MRNKVAGKQAEYRKVNEDDMSLTERRRAYDRAHQAEGMRMAQCDLVAAASHERAGFAEMARWVVATCKSGMELSIAHELKEKAVECWCPVERKVYPPRRGLKAVVVRMPLFRGYLFVRIVPDTEAYAGLLSASRLSGLMGRDGVPELLPERLVHILKRSTLKYDQENAEYQKLQKGHSVTVRSGPFADFSATVRRVLSNSDKIEVETALFGRMTVLTLDVDSVYREE